MAKHEKSIVIYSIVLCWSLKAIKYGLDLHLYHRTKVIVHIFCLRQFDVFFAHLLLKEKVEFNLGC